MYYKQWPSYGNILYLTILLESNTVEKLKLDGRVLEDGRVSEDGKVLENDRLSKDGKVHRMVGCQRMARC